MPLFEILGNNSNATLAADTDTSTISIISEKDGVKTKLFDVDFGDGTPQTLLAGPDEVTITNASQDLPTLLGTAVQANIKKLTIINNSGGTFAWASGGAAVAGTNDFSALAIEINILKAQADLLEFIVSAGTLDVTILQEG